LTPRPLCQVTSREELLTALAARETTEIQVAGVLRDLPSLRLAPGCSLVADGDESALYFASGQDGIELTSDNAIAGMRLVTGLTRRALFIGPEVAELGRIELTDLHITGNVRLLIHAKGGHIEGREIHIAEADARGFEERPAGFGVEVVPAVFTIWNVHDEPSSFITADLVGISAGSAGAPVRGGGVFVGGIPEGGRALVRRLETGEVHCSGGILEGTPDRIAGGVFVVHGAWVDQVRNKGTVTTYGANDMVLDNWGTVETWQADAKITSYGPSAIGFVNFGAIGSLRVDGVIETFGLGARGFNVYAGTIRDATFEHVVTRADGAVGVQISQRIGRLAVRRGIETFGGVGASLVKGVVKQLPAIALSIKPGGSAREITVGAGVVAHGQGIEALEMHGTVDIFSVTGSIGPVGGGFDKM
jgi:hypothetical protein